MSKSFIMQTSSTYHFLTESTLMKQSSCSLSSNPHPHPHSFVGNGIMRPVGKWITLSLSCGFAMLFNLLFQGLYMQINLVDVIHQNIPKMWRYVFKCILKSIHVKVVFDG